MRELEKELDNESQIVLLNIKTALETHGSYSGCLKSLESFNQHVLFLSSRSTYHAFLILFDLLNFTIDAIDEFSPIEPKRSKAFIQEYQDFKRRLLSRHISALLKVSTTGATNPAFCSHSFKPAIDLFFNEILSPGYHAEEYAKILGLLCFSSRAQSLLLKKLRNSFRAFASTQKNFVRVLRYTPPFPRDLTSVSPRTNLIEKLVRVIEEEKSVQTLAGLLDGLIYALLRASENAHIIPLYNLINTNSFHQAAIFWVISERQGLRKGRKIPTSAIAELINIKKLQRLADRFTRFPTLFDRAYIIKSICASLFATEDNIDEIIKFVFGPLSSGTPQDRFAIHKSMLLGGLVLERPNAFKLIELVFSRYITNTSLWEIQEHGMVVYGFSLVSALILATFPRVFPFFENSLKQFLGVFPMHTTYFTSTFNLYLWTWRYFTESKIFHSIGVVGKSHLMHHGSKISTPSVFLEKVIGTEFSKWISRPINFSNALLEHFWPLTPSQPFFSLSEFVTSSFLSHDFSNTSSKPHLIRILKSFPLFMPGVFKKQANVVGRISSMCFWNDAQINSEAMSSLKRVFSSLHQYFCIPILSTMVGILLRDIIRGNEKEAHQRFKEHMFCTLHCLEFKKNYSLKHKSSSSKDRKTIESKLEDKTTVLYEYVEYWEDIRSFLEAIAIVAIFHSKSSILSEIGMKILKNLSENPKHHNKSSNESPQFSDNHFDEAFSQTDSMLDILSFHNSNFNPVPSLESFSLVLKTLLFATKTQSIVPKRFLKILKIYFDICSYVCRKTFESYPNSTFLKSNFQNSRISSSFTRGEELIIKTDEYSSKDAYQSVIRSRSTSQDIQDRLSILEKELTTEYYSSIENSPPKKEIEQKENLFFDFVKTPQNINLLFLVVSVLSIEKSYNMNDFVQKKNQILAHFLLFNEFKDKTQDDSECKASPQSKSKEYQPKTNFVTLELFSLNQHTEVCCETIRELIFLFARGLYVSKRSHTWDLKQILQNTTFEIRDFVVETMYYFVLKNIVDPSSITVSFIQKSILESNFLSLFITNHKHCDPFSKNLQKLCKHPDIEKGRIMVLFDEQFLSFLDFAIRLNLSFGGANGVSAYHILYSFTLDFELMFIRVLEKLLPFYCFSNLDVTKVANLKSMRHQVSNISYRTNEKSALLRETLVSDTSKPSKTVLALIHSMEITPPKEVYYGVPPSDHMVILNKYISEIRGYHDAQRFFLPGSSSISLNKISVFSQIIESIGIIQYLLLPFNFYNDSMGTSSSRSKYSKAKTSSDFAINDTSPTATENPDHTFNIDDHLNWFHRLIFYGKLKPKHKKIIFKSYKKVSHKIDISLNRRRTAFLWKELKRTPQKSLKKLLKIISEPIKYLQIDLFLPIEHRAFFNEEKYQTSLSLDFPSNEESVRRSSMIFSELFQSGKSDKLFKLSMALMSIALIIIENPRADFIRFNRNVLSTSTNGSNLDMQRHSMYSYSSTESPTPRVITKIAFPAKLNPLLGAFSWITLTFPLSTHYQRILSNTIAYIITNFLKPPFSCSRIFSFLLLDAPQKVRRTRFLSYVLASMRGVYPPSPVDFGSLECWENFRELYFKLHSINVGTPTAEVNELVFSASSGPKKNKKETVITTPPTTTTNPPNSRDVETDVLTKDFLKVKIDGILFSVSEHSDYTNSNSLKYEQFDDSISSCQENENSIYLEKPHITSTSSSVFSYESEGNGEAENSGSSFSEEICESSTDLISSLPEARVRTFSQKNSSHSSLNQFLKKSRAEDSSSSECRSFSKRLIVDIVESSNPSIIDEIQTLLACVNYQDREDEYSLISSSDGLSLSHENFSQRLAEIIPIASPYFISNFSIPSHTDYIPKGYSDISSFGLKDEFTFEIIAESLRGELLDPHIPLEQEQVPGVNNSPSVLSVFIEALCWAILNGPEFFGLCYNMSMPVNYTLPIAMGALGPKKGTDLTSSSLKFTAQNTMLLFESKDYFGDFLMLTLLLASQSNPAIRQHGVHVLKTFLLDIGELYSKKRICSSPIALLPKIGEIIPELALPGHADLAASLCQLICTHIPSIIFPLIRSFIRVLPHIDIPTAVILVSSATLGFARVYFLTVDPAHSPFQQNALQPADFHQTKTEENFSISLQSSPQMVNAFATTFLLFVRISCLLLSQNNSKSVQDQSHPIPLQIRYILMDVWNVMGKIRLQKSPQIPFFISRLHNLISSAFDKITEHNDAKDGILKSIEFHASISASFAFGKNEVDFLLKKLFRFPFKKSSHFKRSLPPLPVPNSDHIASIKIITENVYGNAPLFGKHLPVIILNSILFSIPNCSILTNFLEGFLAGSPVFQSRSGVGAFLRDIVRDFREFEFLLETVWLPKNFPSNESIRLPRLFFPTFRFLSSHNSIISNTFPTLFQPPVTVDALKLHLNSEMLSEKQEMAFSKKFGIFHDSVIQMMHPFETAIRKLVTFFDSASSSFRTDLRLRALVAAGYCGTAKTGTDTMSVLESIFVKTLFIAIVSSSETSNLKSSPHMLDVSSPDTYTIRLLINTFMCSKNYLDALIVRKRKRIHPYIEQFEPLTECLFQKVSDSNYLHCFLALYQIRKTVESLHFEMEQISRNMMKISKHFSTTGEMLVPGGKLYKNTTSFHDAFAFTFNFSQLMFMKNVVLSIISFSLQEKIIHLFNKTKINKKILSTELITATMAFYTSNMFKEGQPMFFMESVLMSNLQRIFEIVTLKTIHGEIIVPTSFPSVDLFEFIAFQRFKGKSLLLSGDELRAPSFSSHMLLLLTVHYVLFSLGVEIPSISMVAHVESELASPFIFQNVTRAYSDFKDKLPSITTYLRSIQFRDFLKHDELSSCVRVEWLDFSIRLLEKAKKYSSRPWFSLDLLALDRLILVMRNLRDRHISVEQFIPRFAQELICTFSLTLYDSPNSREHVMFFSTTKLLKLIACFSFKVPSHTIPAIDLLSCLIVLLCPKLRDSSQRVPRVVLWAAAFFSIFKTDPHLAQHANQLLARVIKRSAMEKDFPSSLVEQAHKATVLWRGSLIFTHALFKNCSSSSKTLEENVMFFPPFFLSRPEMSFVPTPDFQIYSFAEDEA
eukprot:gnl/Chilomastix_cuspidata/5997.p1 GENE.gnl/Chilomastix_cuspidata/5997~~gnl/Chilomastix_cuspidata/5997.p1  ORF type:complete len:3073 (+),score=395.05 gnl/Chilomastix_cuspidata/5997:69-9287(+)